MPPWPSGARSSAPRPILPPTSQRRPASTRIWPIRAVVVDLPLVPVMPMKPAFGWARASSSMSQMIGLPAARAATATGCGLGRWLGMPGLMTSAAARDHSMDEGSTIGTPILAAASREAALSSQATQSIPAALRACTVARPERASPSTTNDEPLRTPRSIIRSPELQGGETGHRQDGGDDPEAEDDGGLGPALLLEMMVQRRHAEDAPAGPFVGQDLDDDRYRLEDEQTADDGQHDLVLGDDGDRAQGAADGERPGVAHEHHGGRRVEPQEAQARADQRGQQHGELARARDVMEIEIVGENGVAHHVGNEAEHGGGHDHRPDRQAVEAVGEVDGVGGAHDHQDGEEHETDDAERQQHVL